MNHLEAFRNALKSQYHASLAMLRESVEMCSEELWLDKEPANAYWQVAYHTLFFTHLYLCENEAAFRPWAGHQSETQNPDGIAGPPDPKSSLPLIPQPYTINQVLEYCGVLDRMIDGAVDSLDLLHPECGFPWYKMSKLEHQLANLRHLQHGAAQLADRLRANLNLGVRWVKQGPPVEGRAYGA